MQLFDSRSIIERMKDKLNIKGDKELIAILGVPQSTFSNWKNRNALPAEIFIKFANERNIDLNWLILGIEKMEELPVDEQMLLDDYRLLSKEQKKIALRQMSGLGNGASGGVNQVANGNNNNQQVFNRDVVEVVGIKK